MGYFSNGTEGMAYEARYCDNCVHQGPADGPGCVVWLAHMLWNYRDCTDNDSILHLLIPRNGIENEQCRMFLPVSPETPLGTNTVTVTGTT
jgi:hypothetical protein